MKKSFIGIVLMCVILVFNSCVYAAAANSGSEQMTKALTAVKSKITVPDGLDKFKSTQSKLGDKTEYSFYWYNENQNETLNVYCDSEGRITSYNFYSYDIYSKNNEKKIPQFSNSDVRKYADEFLKKLLPEAFADETDVIKEDGEMNAFLTDNGANYYINYSRYKNGNIVYGDNVNLGAIAKNGQLYITDVGISYNYDAKFEEKSEEKENITEIYKEKFPVEMVYKKEYTSVPYRYSKNSNTDNPVYLVYRLQDYNKGFISAYTGEVIKPDESDDIRMYANEMKSADSSAGGKGDGGFTSQEISEIDNMAGLITTDEAQKKLISLKALKIDSSIHVESSRAYKTDDGYYMNIYLEKTGDKNYRYVYAKFDAQTGKLLSISNGGKYSDKEFSENRKKTAEKTINEFVKTVAGDEVSQCEAEDTEYYGNSANKSFVRVVNGVKYPDNTITVSYSGTNDYITSYYLDFDKDVSGFKSPDGTIDAKKAYEKMLEFAPLVKQYIPNGETYKLAYTMSGIYDLDAFTGDKSEHFSNEQPLQDINYADIDGHWCEKAVKTLAQYGIALEGSEFKPDENISQLDLFKLLCNVFYYNGYSNEEPDRIYKSLIEDGILAKDERADSSPVKREDAFMYMVRMNGYERIASLADIFVVNFADPESISHSKTGYAAILSGMGVISGDGGYVRGNENLTRAEAISLIYNWLTDIGVRDGGSYNLDGSIGVTGGADGPTKVFVSQTK